MNVQQTSVLPRNLSDAEMWRGLTGVCGGQGVEDVCSGSSSNGERDSVSEEKNLSNQDLTGSCPKPARSSVRIWTSFEPDRNIHNKLLVHELVGKLVIYLD